MKHAKKSLLIPILALFSVIAIIAGCYMVQAVTAHADGEEVESAAVEASEVGVPAPGAEDPENLGEAEPNPSPTEDGFWAKIHLSNGAMFSGTEYEDWGDIYSDDGEDYIAWTGEHYFHISAPSNEIMTDWPYDPIGAMYDPQSVYIYGYNGSDNPDYWGWYPPFCRVNVSPFFKVTGVNADMDWSGNFADVTISVVSIDYYIGFSANGGEFYNDVTDNTSYIEWIAQSEYNPINTPIIKDPSDGMEYPLIPHKDGYYFAGWFTDPWGGVQINEGYQVPAAGELVMLYAHYVDNDDMLNFHFTTDNFSMFKYRLEYHDTLTPGEGTLVDDNDGKPVFSYDIPKDIRPSGYTAVASQGTFYYDNDLHTNAYSLHWVDYDETYIYSLYIYPSEGQRITSVNTNGTYVDYGEYTGSRCFSKYNNIVLTIGWETPGYLSVSSNNGQLFECEIDVYEGSEDYDGPDVTKFVTDFVPIFVDSDDYVIYSYGSTNIESAINNTNGFLENDSTGIAFTIEVCDTKTVTYTYYRFRNNFASVFDWLNFNTYIKGVNFDGESLPIANKWIPLFQNGFYTFELEMSDKDFDTTVTYDANGGHFADDSTSMTVDATYGEPLPVVEAPKAIDNDFVGWFTEPEGGVQVDPEHFIWMPWQRETGVTLYAHWAYNPQPVPPEPVPPTPPEPVNPDVPGGGGTAQTGDSMPLVPIAALAVIAALGCGLAIRKEYF